MSHCLTLAVPVQTLLCLPELGVDGLQLALNQRLFHIQHGAGHLQPGGGRKRDAVEYLHRRYHFNKTSVWLPKGQTEAQSVRTGCRPH